MNAKSPRSLAAHPAPQRRYASRISASAQAPAGLCTPSVCARSDALSMRPSKTTANPCTSRWGPEPIDPRAAAPPANTRATPDARHASGRSAFDAVAAASGWPIRWKTPAMALITIDSAKPEGAVGDEVVAHQAPHVRQSAQPPRHDQPTHVDRGQERRQLVHLAGRLSAIEWIEAIDMRQQALERCAT